MNVSDLIHATTQPYSSLERKIQVGNVLFDTRSLAFTMQAQTQSNWCWAATATSVSLFYWFLSGWTQCKVASSGQNLQCCNTPLPSGCNVSWYLEKALAITKNYVSETGTVTFDQVKAEIDAGRPVGARIGWSGGGGHFVVIYGYTQILFTDDYFDIADPIYGNSQVSVSTFTSSYQTTGSWTNTYFTKSYIHMPFIPILIAEEVLQNIWQQRALLGVKAGLPVQEIESTAGRTLGLAHPIYTISLDQFTADSAQVAQTGVRIIEFSGETPRALYDVADGQTGKVQQMSATSPYLELLPRALAAAPAPPEGAQGYELRLLRVPALNFEALWLHATAGGNDTVIPLRGFHGLAAMQPVPLDQAIGQLREPAQAASRQDGTMGA